MQALSSVLSSTSGCVFHVSFSFSKWLKIIVFSLVSPVVQKRKQTLKNKTRSQFLVGNLSLAVVALESMVSEAWNLRVLPRAWYLAAP